MNPLVDHFRRQTKLLRAEFEVSATARSTVSKGKAREIFVSRFLENHLPSRFKMGRGEIIDSEGNRSGEQDIVVYEGRFPRLHVGDSDVFLVEDVSLVVEVKSLLNRLEFHRWMDQVVALKKLVRQPIRVASMGKIYQTVRCYLFAWSGPKLETVWRYTREYIREKHIDPYLQTFDCLSILDNGVIIKLIEGEEEERPAYPRRGFIVEPHSEDALLGFFVRMIGQLQGIEFSMWDIGRYLGHEDVV